MNKMTVATFECLPVDILFQIFAYLSSIDILRSFLLLNKRYSTIIRHQYLWHIHIGDNPTSLSIFNDLCQNVFKLVGARIVSLRITLTNAIGGWSLVSSSLKYHQTTLLRHLHLIDIEPHEFDKLLSNRLIKQLHTLLVDTVESGSFDNQVVEGAYLAKVCSQLPALRICRLPFNFCPRTRKQLSKCSALPLMTLPNLSNTIYLHTLTLGINTSHFLECLLAHIPFIHNLSIGIQDSEIIEDDRFDKISLPVAVDARLLCHLSRLSINCLDNISFHRAVALLSSVFSQLSRLSLKLDAYTLATGPLIISGDTIQQLCMDRLKPLAIYILDLSLYVEDDLEEKVILNSFLEAPFTRREQPKVFIKERDSWNIELKCYCFVVHTSPYKGTIFEPFLFPKNLQVSSQMSVDAVGLFPRVNELFINGFNSKSCLSDLDNCRDSLSPHIPWSLLKKISIDDDAIISAAELKAILQMAYNVDTLQISHNEGILNDAIFRDTDSIGARVNRQIQSLDIEDYTLTLCDAQDFCMLLCNRLPNLKKVVFRINDSCDGWSWKPSCIVDGQNKSTKLILNFIHFLVDHLQQLVSLLIIFCCWAYSDTPCFPHLIRRQLHECPLSRPYRLRCSSTKIQIWL